MQTILKIRRHFVKYGKEGVDGFTSKDEIYCEICNAGDKYTREYTTDF